MTNRRIRDVLPTEPSPRRTTFALTAAMRTRAGFGPPRISTFVPGYPARRRSRSVGQRSFARRASEARDGPPEVPAVRPVHQTGEHAEALRERPPREGPVEGDLRGGGPAGPPEIEAEVQRVVHAPPVPGGCGDRGPRRRGGRRLPLRRPAGPFRPA